MESLSIQVPIPVFARMTDKLRQELMAAEQEKLENFEAQLLTLQNYSRNEPGMLEQQQKLMAQHEACQLRANKIQEAPAGSKFMLRVLQGSLPLKVPLRRHHHHHRANHSNRSSTYPWSKGDTAEVRAMGHRL